MKLTRKVSFNEFIREKESYLAQDGVVAQIDTYSEDDSNFDLDFAICLENLVYLAYQKLNDEIDKVALKPYLNTITKGLTFENLNSALSTLPKKYGKEDAWFTKMFDAAFYSLLVLDKKLKTRFEVAFRLEQNKVEVGCAGFSEKLQKEIPFYFTHFDGWVFIIDPIRGEVKKLRRRVAIGEIKCEGDYVWVDKQPVARVFPKAIEILEEALPAHSDRKEAERERAREQGHTRKETTWQTTALGDLRGSAKNIRTHSLICLMVFGLDIMKYAIMESNSIMTVDHLNEKHDDNRIDNLNLLTRTQNINLKSGHKNFYFDYFLYFTSREQVTRTSEEIKPAETQTDFFMQYIRPKTQSEIDFDNWYNERFREDGTLREQYNIHFIEPDPAEIVVICDD